VNDHVAIIGLLYKLERVEEKSHECIHIVKYFYYQDTRAAVNIAKAIQHYSTILMKSMVFPGYAKQGRVAALAKGALVPAPIVRAVSCYETRRVGERAREESLCVCVCV